MPEKKSESVALKLYCESAKKVGSLSCDYDPWDVVEIIFYLVGDLKNSGVREEHFINSMESIRGVMMLLLGISKEEMELYMEKAADLEMQLHQAGRKGWN